MLDKKSALPLLFIIAVFLSSQLSAEPPPSRRSSNLANFLYQRYKDLIFSVDAYTLFQEGDSTRWQHKVGTAFPIDSEGYLITLASLIKDADRIRVVTSEGERVRARLLGFDSTENLAILKIDKQVVNIPGIASFDDLDQGAEIFFLGVMPEMAIAINRGIVGNINRADGSFEIDVSGHPGTSGTPVFGLGRNIVGILAYRIDTGETKSEHLPARDKYVAISVEHAALLAQSLIRELENDRPWIGIGVNLRYSSSDGVIVERVFPDGPGFKAGILPQDEIIEFDGKQISTPHQLFLAFRQRIPGDTVPVRIRRDGKRMLLQLTIESRPARPNGEKRQFSPENKWAPTP